MGYYVDKLRRRAKRGGDDPFMTLTIKKKVFYFYSSPEGCCTVKHRKVEKCFDETDGLFAYVAFIKEHTNERTRVIVRRFKNAII